MSMDFIAHIRRNEDGSWAKPHELRVHLRDTAKAAKTFASKFLSGDWGESLGLGHDVGKGRLAWLNYLKSLVLGENIKWAYLTVLVVGSRVSRYNGYPHKAREQGRQDRESISPI